jgi:NhaD family Na+/H+ antiporter
MIPASTAYTIAIFLFIVGYIAIISEYRLKVNKTASALLMAVIMWTFFFLIRGHDLSRDLHFLNEHVSDISQIIFFLLGAMAIVELIDAHKGFTIITDLIQTQSKKKLLWVLGILTFFLSSILDNLTTAIVVVSLLRKLVPDKKERMILASMIVIAANAGGAWTPIGDITTTMLWIHGNITSWSVMKALFLPSFLSLVAALFMLGRPLKGSYSHLVERAHADSSASEPGARLVFFCGVGALIFVPLFKALTGLPPFMGILIGLGFLWLVTDILHGSHETRKHLKLPHVFTKIDISSVMFFLGILLCVASLEAFGILRHLADLLDQYIGNLPLIATIIGLVSAVIDNVPLVAASMGMYDLSIYPADTLVWQMLAYCAGTGGSIFLLGSAAGVVLMGMEKIDVIWYFRKISWIAFVSYLSGVVVFLLQNALFF